MADAPELVERDHRHREKRGGVALACGFLMASVHGSGDWVWGFGFRVYGSWFRVLGIGECRAVDNAEVLPREAFALCHQFGSRAATIREHERR